MNAPRTHWKIFAGFRLDDGVLTIQLDSVEAALQREAFTCRLGQTLTLRFGSKRYCCGRYDLRTGQSSVCPERREVQLDASPQCIACERATGFNPAFYNAQEVSLVQQERNSQPHCTYLAAFSERVVKVGMTHALRSRQRLLEQGARMGIVLKQCSDAHEARELEEWVARNLPVNESVRSSQKRKLLGHPCNPQRCAERLLALAREIYELRSDSTSEPQLIHLEEEYGSGSLSRVPVDLQCSEPPLISGDVLGLVGDILVTRQGGKHFMLSLGAFKGHTVRLDSHHVENQPQGQLGLLF